MANATTTHFGSENAPQQVTIDRSPYDLPFFCTFVANTSLMIAISVLFRYSDFVEYANGDEFRLGLIVGIGTMGALATRVIQGIGVDALGPRKIWLVSLALYTLSVWAHLAIDDVNGPLVYLCRALMQCGMAGTFGASIVFISLRVPQHRSTEVIGIIGTSGFLGMAIGPIIGDVIFASEWQIAAKVHAMFITAGILATFSLLFAWIATRNPPPIKVSKRRPPSIPILRKYSPTMLLFVGIAMGMGLGLPGVFLRPYTSSMGIEQLKLFFITYNIVGITIRLSTRRVVSRLGDRRLILIGLGALVVAMPSFLLVKAPWQLALPAAVTGIAHAFLFPAVISSGGQFFPNRYRGIAIALMLGTFDLGNILGQPMLGSIIKISQSLQLPEFQVMFFSAGAILFLVWISFFAWGTVTPARKS